MKRLCASARRGSQATDVKLLLQVRGLSLLKLPNGPYVRIVSAVPGPGIQVTIIEPRVQIVQVGETVEFTCNANDLQSVRMSMTVLSVSPEKLIHLLL